MANSKRGSSFARYYPIYIKVENRHFRLLYIVIV